MLLIAIDPGMAGGIAYEFNGKIYTEKMPATPKDVYELLKSLVYRVDGYEDVTCYIERVGGYVSGNSGTAAVKFARHVGNLEMALLALNIKYIEVAPSKWMNYFIGRQKYPASITASQKKTKRKNLIKAKAQALYPEIKVTLAISDAIGILTYGGIKCQNGKSE